ncbi:MAG TPA: hypothetical protein ENK18_19395 [Deltaproteobacteria bacterium]|nr:hypothetical protein [Deltaproteobacteria bacterium]
MREDARWLTMNDGIQLDASVCLPDGAVPPGGWPAVILVHGHGEDGSKASTLPRGRRLAGEGYVTLCYSVRGQGGSEGQSFHLGAQEIFDLQVVVDTALRELPIHPERLAVCGSSQGGWHSWMAAAHCPQVATVVPENIFVDYADFAVPDGALSTWFFTRTMRRRVVSAGLQGLARRWAIDGAWDRLRAWLAPMSPIRFTDRIQAPVLCVHGWHDVGMPANDLIKMFGALDVPRRLVLGGGGHDGQDEDSVAAARVDLIDRWLSHWLRGDDTGILDEPSITYVRRPGWTHHGTDRIGGGQEHTLYLSVDDTLSEAAPTAPAANKNIDHTPRDPAYTLSVALHHDLVGSREAWPRQEACFDGPILTHDLDLLGAPRFQLYTLPSRPFGQIHAELHDVAPDGSSTLITRGHQGFCTATPGAHRRCEITARAIAHRVAAGHRLRVVVCDQHPDYVVPVYRPWRSRLYCEVGRASSVTLPLG